MNVFIDLGAYNGDSIEEFRNWSKLCFPDKKDWAQFAFDPNPGFREIWDTKENEYSKFFTKAAWIEDTELEFSIEDSPTPVGSSVMKTKNTYDAGVKIKVQAFDFSDWLKQFENDYVVIKMDIEGAEFPVLWKMIHDGTHLIPAHLLVEFHPNKVSEFSSKDKEDLINKLKSDGVNILEWH